MALALRIPIFNKKSHPTQAVERLKNSIVVKLLQWEVYEVPQFVSDHFFLLKIGVLRAKGITKSFPNLEECDPNLDPHIALHIKAVIVVLY